MSRDEMGNTDGLGPILYSGGVDELNRKLRVRDDRITKLNKDVKNLVNALTTFASFAETAVDKNGCWTSGIAKEPINCWFGPSDFEDARKAIKEVLSDVL